MHRRLPLAWTLATACLLAPAPSGRGRAESAPEAARVVHRLPFPAGATYNVFQGNDQGPTHSDVWNKYAFDFSPMAPGSDVCATADGVVTYVKEDTVGPTDRVEDNNEIAIQHADDTVGVYLHLQKDGALVEVGQKVFAGDVIGKSGNTGKSGAPHLHWCLKEGTRLGVAIPSKFDDVPGDGVPKTGDQATSKNVAVRPVVDALDRLDAAYDRAKRFGCLEGLGPVLAALPKTPPADVAAALARFPKRAEAAELYAQRRDALLARHQADAAAAIEALAAARASGPIDAAVALATSGRRDYATVPTAVTAFDAALAELRKDPGYAKAAFALGATLAWRRDLSRAFELEAKASEKMAAKKRAGWSTVFGIYDGLVSRAPSPEAKSMLTEYVAALRTKVGKAE